MQAQVNLRKVTKVAWRMVRTLMPIRMWMATWLRKVRKVTRMLRLFHSHVESFLTHYFDVAEMRSRHQCGTQMQKNVWGIHSKQIEDD